MYFFFYLLLVWFYIMFICSATFTAMGHTCNIQGPRIYLMLKANWLMHQANCSGLIFKAALSRPLVSRATAR